MVKNKKFNVKNMLETIFFNGLVLYVVVVMISTPFIYYELTVEKIDTSFLKIIIKNLKDCLRFFIVGSGVGLLSYIFDLLRKNKES